MTKIRFLILFLVMVLGGAAAAEVKPVFRTCCPFCDAKTVQAAKRITVTRTAPVPGGMMQQRTGDFKCHCGKVFTQPLSDKFVPAQPVAEEVVLQPVQMKAKTNGTYGANGTNGALAPLPPLPPYPGPVNPRK